MKRFSISRLEEARKNPALFGKNLNGDPKDGPRNFSKYMAWQLALFNFHKTKKIADAINYFETIYWRNFVESGPNRSEYERYLDSINAYIDDHRRKKYVFIDGKVKIDLSLSDKVKITGQIPIINLSTIGYSVFFLSRAGSGWEDELKFPVVQNYIANLFGVDLDSIEVGVYDLASEKHIAKVYSKRTVNEAIEELQSIGGIITANITDPL